MTNISKYFKIYLIISCHILLSQSSNATKNSSLPQTPNCLKDQSSTLIKFKQEFSIKPRYLFTTSYPKTKTWKVNENCCSWDGVECGGTGHVIGLDLAGSWLWGPLLSNSSLFDLGRLRRLNLAYNYFNGSKIPPRFGQLSALTHLNLTWSSLSGDVSDGLSPLESLVSLDLSYNEFSPLESHQVLTRNKDLKSLDLSSLDLSRLGLNFLSNFSSLESLSLKFCYLRGEFPVEIFHLPGIKSIILSGTGLYGFLPDFRTGSKLEYLDLSATKFSGQIPFSIGRLVSLSSFNLARSKFSGIIPSSIGSLSKIEYLSFSDNNFWGKLPPSIGNLTRVTELDLSRNSFNGQIPTTFGDLKSIVTLLLDDAGLNGKLPSSLGNLAELDLLSLRGNRFSGNLPESIANLTRLAFLDVSNNSLTGLVPPALFEMTSLYLVDLENNQFSGPVSINPNTSSSQIMFISLSGNKLSGKIPRSISGLKNLELLDLESNQFSGVFEFKTFLDPLPKLTYLFLSENSNLSVKFSRSASTLSNFSYLGLASCNVAEFPGFLGTQTGLRFLDLSRNNLSGEIPAAAIGNLRSLIVLNLSSNGLEGKIPETLGNLKELLLVDLSRNELSGQIPRELASLKSLVYLDVSNNRLSGPIPRSPQFDTFPNSSFAGNKDLCGFPLSKKC